MKAGSVTGLHTHRRKGATRCHAVVTTTTYALLLGNRCHLSVTQTDNARTQLPCLAFSPPKPRAPAEPTAC